MCSAGLIWKKPYEWLPGYQYQNIRLETVIGLALCVQQAHLSGFGCYYHVSFVRILPKILTKIGCFKQFVRIIPRILTKINSGLHHLILPKDYHSQKYSTTRFTKNQFRTSPKP